MGVSFFEMCYFHIPKTVTKRIENGEVVYKFLKIEEKEDQNVHYSKELLNIIDLMLEEDKNKRKTSKQILEMIQAEYSKKYIKNSSIDSILRCLYSLVPLTNNFLNIQFYQYSNKPITKAFILCLKSFTKPLLSDWINSVQYFRQTLCSENPKLEGTKEIEPRFVFAFLIKELHKELNNPQNIHKEGAHLIISGEESSKTSKVEMMLKFVNDLKNKFNSLISDSFLGLMKITNVCNECKIKTFSFNSFFFVTFNLEFLLKNKRMSESELN